MEMYGAPRYRAPVLVSASPAFRSGERYDRASNYDRRLL